MILILIDISVPLGDSGESFVDIECFGMESELHDTVSQCGTIVCNGGTSPLR